MNEQRVAVVGGGIVGLCAAYSLHRAGADVVVVEAGTVGSGASRGNAGWITPVLSGPLPAPGMAKLALASLRDPNGPFRLAPRALPALTPWMLRFWRHCNARDYLAGLRATAHLASRGVPLLKAMADDGVRFELARTGLLFAALHEEKAAGTLEALRPMEEFGYRLPDKPASGEELRTVEPALSDQVEAGFLVEEEHSVHPSSLVDGLATWLREAGVEVLEGTPVAGFDATGGRVTAVRTARRVLPVDAVVLAAGAWTARLARLLHVRLPLAAGKGYSLAVAPTRMPRHSLYLVEAKVGATRLGSRLRLAGTMELKGLDTTVDARRLRAVEEGAQPFLVPWQPGSRQEAWTGMRPMTPDGLPVVGRLPGMANAFVSTGHSMLGMTLGPASGELLAEVVQGGAPPMLRPFDPARLARRATGRSRGR